mgnify:CR=1 FL=1
MESVRTWNRIDTRRVRRSAARSASIFEFLFDVLVPPSGVLNWFSILRKAVILRVFSRPCEFRGREKFEGARYEALKCREYEKPYVAASLRGSRVEALDRRRWVEGRGSRSLGEAVDRGRGSRVEALDRRRWVEGPRPSVEGRGPRPSVAGSRVEGRSRFRPIFSDPDRETLARVIPYFRLFEGP